VRSSRPMRLTLKQQRCPPRRSSACARAPPCACRLARRLVEREQVIVDERLAVADGGEAANRRRTQHIGDPRVVVDARSALRTSLYTLPARSRSHAPLVLLLLSEPVARLEVDIVQHRAAAFPASAAAHTLAPAWCDAARHRPGRRRRLVPRPRDRRCRHAHAGARRRVPHAALVPHALRPAVARQMSGRPAEEVDRGCTLGGVIVHSADVVLIGFALFTILPDSGSTSGGARRRQHHRHRARTRRADASARRAQRPLHPQREPVRAGDIVTIAGSRAPSRT